MSIVDYGQYTELVVDDTIRCVCFCVGSATYRGKSNELVFVYFRRVHMVIFAFSELRYYLEVL